MIVRKLDREEFERFRGELRPSLVVGILLAGDRMSCVDEIVGCVVHGRVVGVATIAPRGEWESGEPTIVALYVLPSERGKGYGKPTLEGAIRRCLELGFTKVRVDVMSERARRVIESLPPELKSMLDAHSFGCGLDFAADQEK